MKTRLDQAHELGRKWRRYNFIGNPYHMVYDIKKDDPNKYTKMAATCFKFGRLKEAFDEGWKEQDAELAAEMS